MSVPREVVYRDARHGVYRDARLQVPGSRTPGLTALGHQASPDSETGLTGSKDGMTGSKDGLTGSKDGLTGSKTGLTDPKDWPHGP